MFEKYGIKQNESSFFTVGIQSQKRRRLTGQTGEIGREIQAEDYHT